MTDTLKMIEDMQKQQDEKFLGETKSYWKALQFDYYDRFKPDMPKPPSLKDYKLVPIEQQPAAVAALVDCLEEAITGLEWRKENPLEGWDESDGEKLIEWKQALAAYKKGK